MYSVHNYGFEMPHELPTFEVLTAVLLKIQVYWQVTPCNWVSGYQLSKDSTFPELYLVVPYVSNESRQ